MRKIKNNSRKVMCAALVLGCALTGFTVTNTNPDYRQDAIAAPILTVKEFNEVQKDILIPAPEPDIVVAEEESAPTQLSERTLVSLGEYRISAYCPCEKCCLKSDGITASGTQATAGRTAAMNGVPFGTKIVIDGHEYTVEDRGGGLGSKIIDIYFDTHEEALNSGLWVMREVFQVVEE